MKNIGPDRRLRVGVVGCAEIAGRRTLPAMVANPDIEVVAIASRDEGRAREFTDRFGGSPLKGYSALIDREDVDAIYNPLPLLLHAEWTERALTAGKHVLVEKPMTDSHKESSRLIELARAKGLVLMENYMFLHHSQHSEVRRMVDGGAIGELRGFSAAFTFPPKPAGDIRYQPGVGGGAFLDFGGYPVKVAMYFLGNDLRIGGAVFREHRDFGAVLSGEVLLYTPAGITAHLSFGMEHSYRNSYRLIGSTGRLLLDWVFTPPETHRPVVRVERQDHREEFVLRADHQFANAISAFVHAVRTGQDLRPQHEDALEQITLLEGIQRQAAHIRV
ncbi:Gfo/Idh/MocA family oxidoreductase [Actinosynnema sp. NPDC047251]|uniref:NDP-hexose 3-ketoreductase n=1 Tax=Saccharothrix espanaensis (strain ATCC 51144 / DSM 44229 / JCM 9112 / NBRC 15066 / NRRL 15764) TaxID=1179773 RepID=K0K4C9_SACES|nr:Gfo/Idh/MocA family oxidoreductase [Saccharothrix espanaensis]CCH33151.1 NDP-hexose 3-ketoreductase [Saccharothrix espanaensis DSM 44229]